MKTNEFKKKKKFKNMFRRYGNVAHILYRMKKRQQQQTEEIYTKSCKKFFIFYKQKQRN